MNSGIRFSVALIVVVVVLLGLYYAGLDDDDAQTGTETPTEPVEVVAEPAPVVTEPAPVEVETTAGRKEYVRRQAAVHDAAAPVRDRLLAAYDDFFLAHALVPDGCEEAKLVV